MSTTDVKYVKPGPVVTREIAGETLLVPVQGNLAERQQVFALDPVAALIWSRLDTPCNESDLVNTVLDGFDVDQATASRDVHEFVEELREAGLVEIAGEETAD